MAQPVVHGGPQAGQSVGHVRINAYLGRVHVQSGGGGQRIVSPHNMVKHALTQWRRIDHLLTSDSVWEDAQVHDQTIVRSEEYRLRRSPLQVFCITVVAEVEDALPGSRTIPS